LEISSHHPLPEDSAFQKPHRRYNPLTGEWVLVSPHRTSRPWRGQTENSKNEKLPEYEEDCYLCPGNQRAGGQTNPDYRKIFVFDNDFPALLPDHHRETGFQGKTYRAMPESGICRVMCFSPRHDLTLARMDKPAIGAILEAWKDQYEELGSIDWVEYVQIFENKGSMMGCSNPHPHCQIWASSSLPEEIRKEQSRQQEFLGSEHNCLLCSVIKEERENSSKRIVYENSTFLAMVPFWAVWPFEILVISKNHLQSMSDLSAAEYDGLAELLSCVTIKYDNLFKTSFPYSMGIHQKPPDNENHPEWHLHMHFYPPLLRSATIRKFMVGYELLATPQRDITPEAAALQIRELPEIHWLEGLESKG